MLQCVSDTKDTEYPEKDTACEIAFLANYAETNNYQGSIGNRKLPDGSVHTYLRAGTVNKDTKKFSEARLSLVQTVDSTPSLFASFNTSEDASATQLTTAKYVLTKLYPTRSTKLDVQASNTIYTAPQDGYFYALGTATDANSYINLFSVLVPFGMMQYIPPTSGSIKVFLPTKKGSKVILGYKNISWEGSDGQGFYFVY